MDDKEKHGNEQDNENENENSVDKSNELTSEEKYYATEHLYTEESDDLPSEFLSEEPSPANEITMMMIPNYRINEELAIKSYTEVIAKQTTKSGIEAMVAQIWEKATGYGAYCERLEKLQEDIEQLNFEEQILRGEFEFIEFREDGDDGEDF